MIKAVRVPVLVVILGLLCVPAVTRVHQRLQSSGTTLSAGYSRSAECPPEKAASTAIPVASVASLLTAVRAPLPRVAWPVHRVRLLSPFELPTDGLRAPPLV